MPFSIEVCRDFRVWQSLGEIPNAIDNRGRISHTVGSIRRDLYTEVARGTALPSDVNR